LWLQVQEEKLRVPEKTEDVDRADTPDSGNAPDTLCSSVADDSLSQVLKDILYILGSRASVCQMV